ncbi:ATP-binding protein [Stigmatella sp. ncwal1]|uniref:histidine kinase n=1 Tax=Stigmatella ashevillensis TaxID=2995309 RepID=A0ABT5D344_9BACT|nr:ATP-binding protein [Stigmatella ashevillena]MDC0707510.1 ATP-binding protein [Stigmatella ashevillena]
MSLVLPRLSERARLSCGVMLLFLAWALVFFLLTVLDADTQAERQVLERALDITRLLARTTASALAEGDAEDGRRHLEMLSFVPDAHFGLLMREEGTPLASWNPERAPKDLQASSQEVHLLEHEAVVRLPLHTQGGPRGTLLVGFSLAELRLERQQNRQHSALLSVLLLGVGVWVVLLLRAGMSRLSLGRPQGEGRQEGPGEGSLSRMQAQLEEQKALLASQGQALRSAQDQLIVADRRVTMGTLSAGVAHEINNPLAYITANIQFSLQEMQRLVKETAPEAAFPEDFEDWEEVFSALSEANDGCSRVQHIVLSLKAFSCGDDDKRVPTELAPVLTAAMNMAGNEIRHRARLVHDFQAVPPVDGNEVRLSQVFLNLLINASHAIEPGLMEQNEIRVATRMGEDGRVRVSISDTGKGMTPEILGRLFTPFFTTKPVGKGTGLGLSVCQGIISSLGGNIEIQSQPGQGSTFTVVLPVSTSVLGEDPEAAAPLPKVKRSRILVVDDELRVGSALRRALGRDHDVLVVQGAREALSQLGQGARFEVILCDVMMPEMNGMEFFAEMERACPAQTGAILFLTGGAFTEATRSFLDQNQARVLRKPIDMDVLREELRVRIEGQTPAPLLPVKGNASSKRACLVSACEVSEQSA